MGEQKECEPLQCKICWKNFKRKDRMTGNPQCHKSHIFHRECLEKWLEMSGKTCCPICQTPYEMIIDPDYIIEQFKQS